VCAGEDVAGAGQLAKIDQHQAEVVEAHSHVGIVRVEPSLEDGQGVLKELPRLPRLSFMEGPLRKGRSTRPCL
jgi:hypothetical protein